MTTEKFLKNPPGPIVEYPDSLLLTAVLPVADASLRAEAGELRPESAGAGLLTLAGLPARNSHQQEDAMTEAEKKVTAMAEKFPVLFGTNQWARLKVLSHLLLQVGTGGEWVNGELTFSFADGPRWGGRPDGEMIRNENDCVPYVYDDFRAARCLAWHMPANARSDWRDLVEEVVRYFLSASKWSFPHYADRVIQFSPSVESRGRQEIRRLASRLHMLRSE